MTRYIPQQPQFYKKTRALRKKCKLKSSGCAEVYASLTWVCNMSLKDLLKGKHRYLFSVEVFCLHFLVIDDKYLLAGRPRVIINGSREGVLMAFKELLPVS